MNPPPAARWPEFDDLGRRKKPVIDPALRNEVLAILYDGPGVAMLHGAPAADELTAAGWLWALGNILGQPVSQTLDGEVIGRIEDAGGDINDPTHRGHRTAAALPFHADRTDVIALLCVRNATSGGLSQLASAARVRRILGKERPDVLALLEAGLPSDRRGEEASGEDPWCILPVFSVARDRVIARYVRRFIESSQRHPDAPRLTPQQIDAMNVLDEVLQRPDVVAVQNLQPGQLQLIENHSVMHARTAFSGIGSGRRLLLRLWLCTTRSPELPETFRPLYRSVGAGTIRGGVWPNETPLAFGEAVAS